MGNGLNTADRFKRGGTSFGQRRCRAGAAMTPGAFIAKWRAAELKERSAAQEHFIDLCRLLDEPTPAEADPKGDWYCFERGARKDSGGDGWADVWKRHHFAWEYKGQARQPRRRFQSTAAIRPWPWKTRRCSSSPTWRASASAPNWTNSVSETHAFTLDDLAGRGHPGQAQVGRCPTPNDCGRAKSRQALTERACGNLCGAGAVVAPPAATNRRRWRTSSTGLVFCMFAEDVACCRATCSRACWSTPASGPRTLPRWRATCSGRWPPAGRVGFEAVAWFNGGLFDDDVALPLDKAEIETILKAAALDWVGN